jgi:hypothetical protein
MSYSCLGILTANVLVPVINHRLTGQKTRRYYLSEYGSIPLDRNFCNPSEMNEINSLTHSLLCKVRACVYSPILQIELLKWT